MTREEMNRAADAVNKEAERRAFKAIMGWPAHHVTKRLWINVYHAKKRELLGL